MASPQGPTRRQFLRKSSLGALAGWGLASRPAWLGAAHPQEPMKYRVLGRTGLKVSEVGFGAYPVDDPAVLEYALDRGINYIDTAHDYRGGRSEETIGKVMSHRRQDAVLATKWHPWSRTKKQEMMDSLDTSLRRLQTDHVDILLVHQVGKRSGGESIERLENPELMEAMRLAKEQGKARYFGVSGHDGDLMEVMNHVLDMKVFDVILCRYNFLMYPEEQALFQRAQEMGVGTIAMKTLAGAKGMDLSRYRSQDASYAQAALRWVLSNPHVSNLIISMASISQVDEYAPASAMAFGEEDRELLSKYARDHGQEVCRMCNKCEDFCPLGVPVADVLRADMYAHDYQWAGEGRRLYGTLPVSAGPCAGCDAPCQKGCDFGLDLRSLLSRAHGRLSPSGRA